MADLELNLSGRTVVTEAATGAYAVTPLLAACAGASVIAATRATRYGSVEQVTSETATLARLLEVSEAVRVTGELTTEDLATADVLTNSGHVRPLDQQMVSKLRTDAVVPLMFEAWEIDATRGDVDLEALRARGVRFAGTNERHPRVGVFNYLGTMAAAALLDAGFPVLGVRTWVLCDNPFATFIEDGLERAGAECRTFGTVSDLLSAGQTVRPGQGPDVLLVALRPTGRPVLPSDLLDVLTTRLEGACIVQYWGDIDRSALAEIGVPFWPTEPPAPGHMAVLPSRVGPDPIVRLQAGGLKVAEVLLKEPSARTAADSEYLDEL